MNIGRRLREERLKTGLKQEEFAALGGASLNSQTRYETGQAAPKLEYLLRIAEQADHSVDIGYIITGYRADGTLGHGQRWLLDLYEGLDSTRREALMNFLLAFSGHVADADNLLGRSAPLHAPGQDFRGEPKDE